MTSTTVLVMRLWRGSPTTRRIATPIFVGSLDAALRWLSAERESRARLWIERFRQPATVVGVLR
jgi:hypothetical protein